MTKICLVAIGDGRDECHERSWASMREMIPPTDYAVVIDDRDHKLGFGGAIREAWRQALQTDATHILHCELDFIYLRPVALHSMITVLDALPYLVQMALLRGPVNDDECAVGGVIEQHPDDYTPMSWRAYNWCEHRRYVTTNPAVWPRWVIERGWPDLPESEGHFGIDLFSEGPSYRAAYWGTEVSVEHIGVRCGVGY